MALLSLADKHASPLPLQNSDYRQRLQLLAAQRQLAAAEAQLAATAAQGGAVAAAAGAPR